MLLNLLVHHGTMVLRGFRDTPESYREAAGRGKNSSFPVLVSRHRSARAKNRRGCPPFISHQKKRDQFFSLDAFETDVAILANCHISMRLFGKEKQRYDSRNTRDVPGSQWLFRTCRWCERIDLSRPILPVTWVGYKGVVVAGERVAGGLQGKL